MGFEGFGILGLGLLYEGFGIVKGWVSLLQSLRAGQAKLDAKTDITAWNDMQLGCIPEEFLGRRRGELETICVCMTMTTF